MVVEPPYWWCQLTIKGQMVWALLLILNLLLILSHFFYYSKIRNGKRNAFANVKCFCNLTWFFSTVELFISHLLLKLRDKHWQRVSKWLKVFYIKWQNFFTFPNKHLFHHFCHNRKNSFWTHCKHIAIVIVEQLKTE